MRTSRGTFRAAASSRRRGHALACTMIFLVLAMLLWTSTFRQTAGWLRTETAQIVRNERELRSARAMAWALTLLETGLPPSAPYSCRAEIAAGEFYVLTFESEQAQRRLVSVRPAQSADLLLPLAPATFAADSGGGNGNGNGNGNGHGKGGGKGGGKK